MKHLFTLAVATLTMTSVSAQYQINLSKIEPVAIKYLKMGNEGPTGKEIRINNLYLEEGGIPQLPVMGEFHYSRMDPRYWNDALMKMKASGVNIVSTYCLWSLHEEFEGEMSWKEHLNLRHFINLCQKLNLKVHLRLGPYCNAEIRNGGLPDWIVGNKKFEVRTNAPLYLEYARRWYQAIYDQVKGLLYKDGGPIMAVQIENEYVKKGLVVSHLMALKKMAVDIGFDVPLYSMTHWMDSEYPKGEIVPYAGFYIETPWRATGKEEIPPSNFEYFTYNRLSDNIGTDIIKMEGDVQTLSGENNDSPFFTCEIGVGTTAFYMRRAVVPAEMAGENINLRLGCGANMMGYYMYVGGSNPVGKATTFQSSGPRICYDYQAPIREFGTLGTVMTETKKLNYFMNDFGSSLAPAVAYLPTSNENRDNLQWAVRLNGNSGYLFCSNYIYKHEKKSYDGVQFSVKLKNETVKIPRQETTVPDGTYFVWPFNQNLGGALLKYATTQPICSVKEGREMTYFFFEDDAIAAEYLIANEGVHRIETKNGVCTKESNGYFINNLTAGKESVIKLTMKNGSVVRFVTLNEADSDHIWKGKTNDREFVAITSSSLIYDQEKITLIDENPESELWIYKNGRFAQQKFQAESHHRNASFRQVAPLEKSFWIHSSDGNEVAREFALVTLANVEKAHLRYVSTDLAQCTMNGSKIEAIKRGEYLYADVTKNIRKGGNNVQFTLPKDAKVAAEIEVLLTNGDRLVWNTDATWNTNVKPAITTSGIRKPTAYAIEEQLAIYEINAPKIPYSNEETRLYIAYQGDMANAYQGKDLVADSYYDGTEWIVGIRRLKEDITVNPLVIRINGLQSADKPIYFEKNVVPENCVIPTLSDVKVKQEYRFDYPMTVKK